MTLRGAELVVANVDGTLLAYRSACAGCHAGLGDATLSGEILTCARCGRGFDLPRAGRALGAEQGQLEPVPLLGRAGTEVKVALAPVSASRPPGALSAEVVRRACGAWRAGSRRPAAAPAVAARRRRRAATCAARAMSEDHRHLLDVGERRILCACEPCCAMRAGEGDLRPTGTRVLRLDDFVLADELWAAFQIPIGLAFFFVSEVAGGVVALYPSPAGATESELYLEAWNELVAANPVLADLEPEVEALSSTASSTRTPTPSCPSIAATSWWG